MNKKKFSARRVVETVLLAIAVIFCLLVGVRVGMAPGYLAGFNVGTDPFGALGDRHLQWWSYNETQNPKVAKFQYLKQHHEAFDSYIIGGSEAGVYPVNALNTYFDAHFYNLANYDADMHASEQYCRYLIEQGHVKNIILNVTLENGMHYNTEKASLKDAMPYQVSGESMLEYYKRFLLADAQYGREKIARMSEKYYLRQAFAVFDATTGSFDTRQEDSVRIGDVASYLQEHPAFETVAMSKHALTETVSCMKSIAAIRTLCEENGVNLIVVVPPTYHTYMDEFVQEDVAAFYKKLSEVTPYWDFSQSVQNQDPRFFYDKTHFRSTVGKMMAARIAKEKDVYIPDDFGVYVPQGGDGRVYEASITGDTNMKKVPILMYHHLIEGKKVDNWDTMTVSRFRQQLKALSQAGYTAVSFEALRQYVNEGVDLPDKPVVITFDDGYESNYRLAVPVLREFNMKATVFVIGAFMGKDTYKDTGMSVPPHFDWEEAQKMDEEGVIDIESHGYNIHEIPLGDGALIREGCLKQDEESETDYVNFLVEDCEMMQALFEEHLNKPVGVLSYPYGKYSVLSEMIAGQEGIDITLSIENGNNILVKGLPQSLKAMRRHFVKEETSPQALIALMES